MVAGVTGEASSAHVYVWNTQLKEQVATASSITGYSSSINRMGTFQLIVLHLFYSLLILFIGFATRTDKINSPLWSRVRYGTVRARSKRTRPGHCSPGTVLFVLCRITCNTVRLGPLCGWGLFAGGRVAPVPGRGWEHPGRPAARHVPLLHVRVRRP